MKRKVKLQRVTKETKVKIELNLDGKGKYKIYTSVPFLDHMLEQFSLHSGFDLYIKAIGDIFIDDHHLVEDIGLALGQAFLKAIRDKKGIKRYGQILSVMDESLSYIVVDISGRPYLDFKVKFLPEYKKSSFDYRLIKEFFKSFVNEAKITLYIKLLQGEDNHHICESIFKGVGRVLKNAVELNKNKNLLSTKGVL